MARRSAMQMDPRTMTGAPRGGGIARSLAPRPQMRPPLGGGRQMLAQPLDMAQQNQMMNNAAMDAGIENAQNQQNAMDNQFNDMMQRVNNYQEPPAPNLMSPPGFGPKPGRMDSRMQGQMQDMMGRMQRPPQSPSFGAMPQYNMPGPSQQYDFADRRPNAQMNNAFRQIQGNQLQPAPQPMGQSQQMPQQNAMSTFLNRNRFGR